ncbi:YndM family protein [Bacillus atrophaeus]|uniref:YndM family protein n=1 Tax=Bacillus atrophaeus TaxID=1452 RepID=UPI0007790131|nr:YndM family protein [Bacillus atrophaeus]KAA6452544.1 DUF2512 family protein [Bacillus atrophaeus]MCY8518582.1 YndM family protein [Bacillus atrophaeus]PRR99289.1 DUF2512 domain-containing protein [Bacillus atrophaeus]
MKHIIALASKIALTLSLLYVILDRIYHVSFLSVLFITFVLGLISYLTGDMLILPRTSNFIATAADFGLSLIILWVFLINRTGGDFSPFFAALIASLGVSVFEYFFHRYLLANVLNEDYRDQLASRDSRSQYQTEASDELSPDLPNKHKE